MDDSRLGVISMPVINVGLSFFDHRHWKSNMNRVVAMAVIILLLGSVFAIPNPIALVSAQSNVVINEVELNPPGNDNYNDTREWVELYNPLRCINRCQ